MDYRQVEQEFRQLKAQYDTGALSAADFKARLQDLMVQDELGRWWMIGHETGQWYVHDGEKWVRSEPKVSRLLPAVTATPTARPQVVLLLGAAMALLVGYGIGKWMHAALFSQTQTTGEVTGSVSGIAAALSGLLVTLALARRAQAEGHLPWPQAAKTLVGWLIWLALACGIGWLVYRAFVNPQDFSGEAFALVAGCVIGIGGSLYLALTVRRNKLGR